jgi:hypothetical protein
MYYRCPEPMALFLLEQSIEKYKAAREAHS